MKYLFKIIHLLIMLLNVNLFVTAHYLLLFSNELVDLYCNEIN